MLKHRLPDTWKVTTLDLHADVRTGLAKGKKDLKDAVSLPYLRVANVQDGYLDLREIKRIELEREDVGRYRLEDGDVLLTEGGDFDKLGRGAVWRGEIVDCLHQNHIFAVRPHLCDLLPQFLAYQTGSGYGKQYFQSCSKQSTNLASINSTQLRQFPLLLPSLPEQRRIVDLLLCWDDAITKTKHLVAAKKKVLSWIRSEVLGGNVRLPGFQGAWQRVRLSTVLTEHGSKSSGQEKVFSVSVHKGLVNQVEHLGRSYAATNTFNYNRVKPGDIIYTKSPTGEFPLGVIKKSTIDEDVIVSPLYGVFTPINNAIGDMLDALFESPVYSQNYLAPLVQKGAKNTIAITNKRFLEGSIVLPVDEDEQLALAVVVRAAREEVKLLTNKTRMLETQKRGLMQRLLTGERRVSVRESDVDVAMARVVEEAAQ